MASALLTKNRWLLTGTPTPSDAQHVQSYLHQQFKFLRHPLFCTAVDTVTSTTASGNGKLNANANANTFIATATPAAAVTMTDSGVRCDDIVKQIGALESNSKTVMISNNSGRKFENAVLIQVINSNGSKRNRGGSSSSSSSDGSDSGGIHAIAGDALWRALVAPFFSQDGRLEQSLGANVLIKLLSQVQF